MAIPPNGWVSTAARAPVTRFPLPEPLSIHYVDHFRFGKVVGYSMLSVGEPQVVNKSGYRLIDIEVLISNVHDVALIDRIF